MQIMMAIDENPRSAVDVPQQDNRGNLELVEMDFEELESMLIDLHRMNNPGWEPPPAAEENDQ